MSDSLEKNLIRFSCPACGIRLEVDRAIAGTQSACQSCGEAITIPPIEAPTSLSEKQAAPISIKPRSLSKKRPSRSPFERVSEGVSGVISEGRGTMRSTAAAAPLNKPARRGRSVSPATAISHSHEQKKDVKALVIMALVTCLVVCFALGVYYFMVYGQF